MMAGRAEALHDGGEHVLLAHHAAVEEGEAGDRHHQDERGRGEHPGGVAGIEGRRCRGGGGRGAPPPPAPARPTAMSAASARVAVSRSDGSSKSSWRIDRWKCREHGRCGSSHGGSGKGWSRGDPASERVGVDFAGTDAHGVIEGEDEDLAVADLAGLGGAADRLDHRVDLLGRRRRPRSSASAGSSRHIRCRGRFRCGPSGGRSP